jgi:hypothetical protein
MSTTTSLILGGLTNSNMQQQGNMQQPDMNAAALSPNPAV